MGMSLSKEEVWAFVIRPPSFKYTEFFEPYIKEKKIKHFQEVSTLEDSILVSMLCNESVKDEIKEKLKSNFKQVFKPSAATYVPEQPLSLKTK